MVRPHHRRPLFRRHDRVAIDAEKKMVYADVDEVKWAKCQGAWKKPEVRAKGGVLAKYARLARSASEGAVAT